MQKGSFNSLELALNAFWDKARIIRTSHTRVTLNVKHVYDINVHIQFIKDSGVMTVLLEEQYFISHGHLLDIPLLCDMLSTVHV